MRTLDTYRLAFDVSPIALVMVCGEGKIRLTNENFDQLFGYPAGALTGQPVEILVPHNFRKSHALNRKLFGVSPGSRKMGRGLGLVGLGADGREIPVELGLEPRVIDGENWTIVSAIDIGYRRRMEDLAIVTLGAAASAMIMFDAGGSVVYANEAAAQLFGYSASEFTALKVRTLIPLLNLSACEENRRRFPEKQVRQAIFGDEPLFGRRRNGREFRVEVGLTPVMYSGEEMAVTTVTDLSERLERDRIEAERAAAEKHAHHLEQLNEDLQSFAYSASHDLKAPLSTIAGLVQLARDRLDERDFETLGEDLARMEDVSRRSARKVERVLRVARHLPLESNKEPVSPRDMLHRIWLDLTAGMADPPEFFVGIPPGSEFMSHPDPLEIIFQNLLSNAIKFADPQKKSRQVHITFERTGGWVEISVTDNGVGFPQMEADRIFRLFSRLTGREGDGIGLALVRKHVQALGGAISAQSHDGEWARFTVRLPVGGAADAPDPEQHAGGSENPREAAGHSPDADQRSADPGLTGLTNIAPASRRPANRISTPGRPAGPKVSIA